MGNLHPTVMQYVQTVAIIRHGMALQAEIDGNRPKIAECDTITSRREYILRQLKEETALRGGLPARLLKPHPITIAPQERVSLNSLNLEKARNDVHT